MLKSWRVSIYTFIAVSVAIFIVGMLAVPILLDHLQGVYFRLQADVNQRQARAMSQFVANRLESGANPDVVIREFQAPLKVHKLTAVTCVSSTNRTWNTFAIPTTSCSEWQSSLTRCSTRISRVREKSSGKSSSGAAIVPAVCSTWAPACRRRLSTSIRCPARSGLCHRMRTRGESTQRSVPSAEC